MYIRTKDGVYEVEQSQLEDDEEVVNCEYGQISKLEIKRKSENIEELCDEFVGYFECFNRSYYFIYKNSYDELKRDVQTIQYSAYGAIWTDKGLLFVAKMNDKGELELI